MMRHLLLTLSLLLICTASSAQQVPATSETGPRQEATPAEQPPEQDENVDNQEDIPLDEDSSANPPPPSSRFEPTEQISEDLSVSFPIDI